MNQVISKDFEFYIRTITMMKEEIVEMLRLKGNPYAVRHDPDFDWAYVCAHYMMRIQVYKTMLEDLRRE